MKNVTLVKSDNYELIVKIYVDKSIRFVQKWKGMPEINDDLFLTSGEVELLLKNIEG